jgi:hypothetical protein
LRLPIDQLKDLQGSIASKLKADVHKSNQTNNLMYTTNTKTKFRLKKSNLSEWSDYDRDIDRRLDNLLNDEESMDTLDCNSSILKNDTAYRPHTVGGYMDRPNKVDSHMNKIKSKNSIDITLWQEYSVKITTDMKDGPRVTFPVLGSSIGEKRYVY